jgi:hypothetical protein
MGSNFTTERPFQGKKCESDAPAEQLRVAFDCAQADLSFFRYGSSVLFNLLLFTRRPRIAEALAEAQASAQAGSCSICCGQISQINVQIRLNSIHAFAHPHIHTFICSYSLSYAKASVSKEKTPAINPKIMTRVRQMDN